VTARRRALRPDFERHAHEVLHAGAPGVDLALAGLAVRVGDAPLFRRGAGGGLRQAVRVTVDSPRDGCLARFAVRDGEREVAAETWPVERGRHAVHLLVPEVTAPTRLRFDAAVDGVELRDVPVEVRPQRKWRIFLVHHSHLDVGYTDPQDRVLADHLAYLDAALELAAATDGWPEAARFRWNVEVNLPLQRWLASRPARRRRTFLELARAGRIEVCALPFSMHTEACSIDELARQLEFAGRLREEHGVPVVTAMQSDVPGATVGLVELLAGAGVRYLAVAQNWAGRSVPHLTGGQALTRPFRWRSPSGAEVLTWHTDTPHGVAYMEGNLVGLATGYEAALDVLPEYLAALAGRPYPYPEGHGWAAAPDPATLTRRPYPHDVLHLRVQGRLADNAPPSPVPAEIVRRWNEEWTYPALRMATNREFFECAERELGDRLDAFTGDWTDWWADGLGSAAREVAANREAQALAPVARTLHALGDALGGEDGCWRPELDRSYERMALFDEHTWGAANPWADALAGRDSGGVQWQRKAAMALDARDGAAASLAHGAARMAELLGAPGAAVAVLNPSGFARTDLVRVFVPAERADLARPFRLVDAATGEPAPCAVEAQARPQHRPRGAYLGFVARGVPALGYRRYALVEDPGGAAPEVARVERSGDAVLQNEHYRVELDVAGARIASLRDVAAGRELVEADSPFGFDQYVHDRYATASRVNHLSSRVPDAGQWLLGGRSVGRLGAVVRRVRTAVWDQVAVRFAGEGAEWVETSVRLTRGVRRVDVRNRVLERPAADKESVFFAFPFALRQPRVAYEITGGVQAADGQVVPGSARHMRAIRHWVTLEDGTAAVAWVTADAPLVQVGNLYLPYAPFPPSFAAGDRDAATVFSWAMNNVWDTNFPAAQGGEAAFRYRVATGPPGSARRLGMATAAESARPLVAVVCGPEGGLPATGSFCEVDGGEVDVVTLGPSRAGHGLVVLLHSLAAAPAAVRLRFPLLTVRRAWEGTHLERDLREAPIRAGEVVVTLAPGAYRALALELGP
jgi:Glycosyl hydrolases family 38 N-terminal domain/Glycosyl hydrolases family 38 C-terminal domain